MPANPSSSDHLNSRWEISDPSMANTMRSTGISCRVVVLAVLRRRASVALFRHVL